MKRARRQLLAAAAHTTGPRADAAAERVIAAALRRFARMDRPLESLSDQQLHSYRIDCKRLRYRLEAMGTHASATRLANHFKRIQDAVGKWHDWLTLADHAQKVLPQAGDALLVRLLRQKTGRQHRQALRVIAAVRLQVGGNAPRPRPTGHHISTAA